VNGNVKLVRAAARSGEWAQHFSNASCYAKRFFKPKCIRVFLACDAAKLMVSCSLLVFYV